MLVSLHLPGPNSELSDDIIYWFSDTFLKKKKKI